MLSYSRSRVCDDCLNIAYDNHIPPPDPAQTMIDYGADMADHICCAVEEPDLIDCACGCERERERIRLYKHPMVGGSL